MSGPYGETRYGNSNPGTNAGGSVLIAATFQVSGDSPVRVDGNGFTTGTVRMSPDADGPICWRGDSLSLGSSAPGQLEISGGDLRVQDGNLWSQNVLFIGGPGGAGNISNANSNQVFWAPAAAGSDGDRLYLVNSYGDQTVVFQGGGDAGGTGPAALVLTDPATLGQTYLSTNGTVATSDYEVYSDAYVTLNAGGGSVGISPNPNGPRTSCVSFVLVGGVPNLQWNDAGTVKTLQSVVGGTHTWA